MDLIKITNKYETMTYISGWSEMFSYWINRNV